MSLPILGGMAFPSIEAFQFEVSLSTLVRFLNPPLPLAQLQRLSIMTPQVESPAQIRTLFCGIAINCPNISKVKLSSPYRSLHDIPEPLTFSCLEPLMACRFLTSFSINTPAVVEFDDTQAACAASSWPLMRKLSLWHLHSLYINRPFRTTFASLSTFAKHCQDLQILKMNVHPSNIPPPGAREPFPKLGCLSLTVGPAKYSRRELASFIAEITPPTSELSIEAAVHVARRHTGAKYEDRVAKVSYNVGLLRRGLDIT